MYICISIYRDVYYIYTRTRAGAVKPRRLRAALGFTAPLHRRRRPPAPTAKRLSAARSSFRARAPRPRAPTQAFLRTPRLVARRERGGDSLVGADRKPNAAQPNTHNLTHKHKHKHTCLRVFWFAFRLSGALRTDDDATLPVRQPLLRARTHAWHTGVVLRPVAPLQLGTAHPYEPASAFGTALIAHHRTGRIPVHLCTGTKSTPGPHTPTHICNGTESIPCPPLHCERVHPWTTSAPQPNPSPADICATTAALRDICLCATQV